MKRPKTAKWHAANAAYHERRRIKAAAFVRPAYADLCWCAGFIEGEGSFSKYGQRVGATQVQREPLERLLRWLGGTIYRGIPKPYNRAKQPCHFWQASGPRGIGIMLTLYPLMSPRRQGQIKKALASPPRQRRECTKVVSAA